MERCNELCTKEHTGQCQLCDVLEERDRFLRMCKGGFLLDGIRFLWAKEAIKIEPTDHQDKPEAPSWLFENIAEASKHGRQIYLLYIGFLAYCMLTVVSTTDRRIILDEPAKLPIVNVEIPLLGFFLTAPFIAILIFIYFQVYLYRIRGLISDLQAQYAPIRKRRLYPWMINIACDPEPGIIGKIQTGVVKLSLWWSLPIVLAL